MPKFRSELLGPAPGTGWPKGAGPAAGRLR